jgi:predicted nucleic acid-binding protein
MAFVDTNVLVAALNEHDSDHKIGKVRLESAFQKFEWLYTSDYVVDECFSIAWSKTRKLPLSFRLSLIKKIDDTVQGSEKLRLLKVDEHDFSTAKALLREHRHHIPTLTDWTSLVLMKKHGIQKIISFDGHFEDVRQLAEFRWVLAISQPSQL